MAAPAPTPRVFDGTLPPPSFASIETTMYCNLSCPFCIQFQDGTTVRGPHMEAATFEAVAAKLFPHLERFQPSVSGEPLMSRGLERILEQAARHGVRGEYYSNGTLLNDRLVALILPTLGRLHISFDGATKATFESLRRGAQFEKVLENIRRVVAAARALPPTERPQIGLACTLQQGNVRELPQLVDLAADLGLDFVGAAHVVPGTANIQTWSLHRHRALAREHIGLAFARARARGMPFWVQPLDELIVAMTDEPEPVSPTPTRARSRRPTASKPTSRRAASTANGSRRSGHAAARCRCSIRDRAPCRPRGSRTRRRGRELRRADLDL